MQNQSSCPVCQESKVVPVLTKYGYTIARCLNCNMIHVSPIPSDEFLQAHYQNPAYFEGEGEQGYEHYADVQKALLPHFKRRLQLINKHINKGRLLDFGCAAGYFLEVAKLEGWEIAGVELSQEMAEQAKHLQVPIVPSLDDLEGDFDVITLWEVIEHLPRPIETLTQLYQRLKPGGIIMVSTPNTGHWQAIREVNSWISYRPPSHLLYFTSQTLQNTLEQAGFYQVSVQKVSPLPPLPNWLRIISSPLQQSLVNGQAKMWTISLWIWRIIRVLGWGWQKIMYPHDDVFAALEAIAFKPK